MITVTFTCWHEQRVARTMTGALSCQVCGETRVARVQAPAPTFTGHAHGPRAVTKDLGPTTVTLSCEGKPIVPLKLIPQGERDE